MIKRRDVLIGGGAIAIGVHQQCSLAFGTQQEFYMDIDIKRNGSRPSQKGPENWFTGTVRIDPLFQATEAARTSAGQVTFEPGARTAWHTHPLPRMGAARWRPRRGDSSRRCGVVSAGIEALARRVILQRQKGRLDGEGQRRAVLKVKGTLLILQLGGQQSSRNGCAGHERRDWHCYRRDACASSIDNTRRASGSLLRRALHQH
jgi:hypothetical protein